MKRFKFYISMMLAACMALPAPVEAAGNKVEKEGQSVSADRTDREAEYAKGEAIILYREQSVLAYSSMEADGLDSDMQIEETYEFEDADIEISDSDVSAGKRSNSLRNNSSGNASGTLKVSLVKSDSYSTEELVKKLSARKDVLAAEPNYRIHALNMEQDPYAKYQWAIDNQGQNHGTEGFDVNPEQEILGAGTEGDECVIALVDTGIDYTHDDLKNVVWNNPVQSNKLRGAHGYDFINYDTDPMDDNGHGSHCSGIMAAGYNDGGIRGVVSNSKVKIMALKILDEEGSGYNMEAVGAYNYIYKAQQLGINVVAVNNSWGGADEEESVILETLINLVGEKGAVSVCAAGNDGGNNDVMSDYPSGSESKYVISVAASNENDELAAFSNYGKESVDIAAPGADILSTVSYDCFNPGIYEEPDKLCSVFENFSDGNLVQGNATGDDAIAYGYAKSNGKANLSLALSDEAYFGPRSNKEKSLKWGIKGAKEGEIYTIYFPYTAGVSSTETHDSIMVKAVGPDSSNTEDIFLGLFPSTVFVNDVQMTEEGTIDSLGDETDIMSDCINGANVDKGNYWNHISGVASPKREQVEKRALAVSLVVAGDGDYEIYLDNMGISKENIPSGQFGKYDYYNGTSMATPYVTGAVAAIAGAYRDEDALDRIAHVLGCTRNSNALTDKVSSGGVLDLSKVEIPNTYIRDISLDAKQNIKIEGRQLAGAVVSVNNQTITPKECTEKEIILDSAGLLNRTLNITVTAGEKVINRECFLTNGAGFGSIGNAWGTLTDGAAVSDGERIYYVDVEGNVSTCLPDQKDETGSSMWLYGGDGYTPALFGMNSDLVTDYTITNLSDIICLDGKLWTVLKLDLHYSEEKILACYNDAGGWKAAAKLPEEFENLEGISIAAHQGKLYLLGGIDVTTGKMQTNVMQMDPLAKKWEVSAQLPEARAFAKAVSIGDKLIVTLGGNEEGRLPHNMIFDGRLWSVSKAEPGNAVESEKYSYFYYKNDKEYQEIPYYSCYVGAVKNGLVYAGLRVENMGDTFFYQPSSDTYVIANYSISNTKLKEAAETEAVVMQDKFYLLAQEKEEVHIYAMPVQSSCIEVVAQNMQNGYIEGGQLKGIQHYMPGDVISIEAEAEEGYFVKSLTVDGKNVTKGINGKYLYRAAVNEPGKRIMASVVFGEYVMSVFMEENLELYAGQSYQMEVFVAPETAENQKINWSSSNPNVASVDKNGMISISKKAKKGSIAVITATAADRNQIKASCTVTVSSAPHPEKNEIAYSGKLAYKVTKSSGKKKTVTCIGFENKAVKSVKIPDTIKINGYTFKVTGISKNAFAKSKKIKSVTIGKNVTSIGQNAFANCTALTSIQVKGTSLKTIGKDALKGIHKKAVVKVPKKQKKAYAAKLRKSGYSGKIK